MQAPIKSFFPCGRLDEHIVLLSNMTCEKAGLSNRVVFFSKDYLNNYSDKVETLRNTSGWKEKSP